jgi:chromosome segregation ATPase
MWRERESNHTGRPREVTTMEARYFAEKERARKAEARVAELEDEKLYVTSDVHALQDELAEAKACIAALQKELPTREREPMR